MFLKKVVLLWIAIPLLTQGYANPVTIEFRHACEQGNTIMIAAVGDILLHTPLQQKGLQSGFESLWQAVTSYIQQADIAYANLEGPMAHCINEYGHITSKKNDRLGIVYTGYPLFNYPEALATALRDSGFNIVSTANNHALDRAGIGIDRTLARLHIAGITAVGTRAREDFPEWVSVKTAKGIRVAFISCTEHTNGNDDNHHQVLYCYGPHDRPLILKTIATIRHHVDAIIVLPHWGEEYENHPNEDQIQFAHQVLNAGASAVIGSHPHVLQPLQKYVTRDGRETLIAYSLGNFVSYQDSPQKRTSIVLLLGLTKTTEGTFIAGVRFIPFYMENHKGNKEMQLKLLPENDHSVYARIISQLLPTGNSLYSQTIILTPQCQIR